MPSPIHRFYQELRPDPGGRPAWYEHPAHDGGAAHEPRPVSGVRIIPPGQGVFGVKQGIRLVIKQLVRLLYLSPLLVLSWLALGLIERYVGIGAVDIDRMGSLAIVGFVLLVVAFFLLLNVYIFWSVVCYGVSRRGVAVRPPFLLPRDEFEAALKTPGGRDGRDSPEADLVRIHGVLTPLDEQPSSAGSLVRDLWVLRRKEPWRATEARDFAVVRHDEPPVIVRLGSAPILVDTPRETPIRDALARMSAGIDVFPRLKNLKEQDRRHRGVWLELNPGDQVELTGRVSRSIPNVEQFELNGAARSLNLSGQRANAPYRGASGTPGLLVECLPDTPVMIRRAGSPPEE